MPKSSKSRPTILQIIPAPPGVYIAWHQDNGEPPIYDPVFAWGLVEDHDEHLGTYRYVAPLSIGEAGTLEPAESGGQFMRVEVSPASWPAPPGGWPAR